MFCFGLPSKMKRFPIRHHIKTISYENTIPFTLYRVIRKHFQAVFVRKRHSVNEALIFKSNMNIKPSNAHVWDIKKESIGYNRHASPYNLTSSAQSAPFASRSAIYVPHLLVQTLPISLILHIFHAIFFIYASHAKICEEYFHEFS